MRVVHFRDVIAIFVICSNGYPLHSSQICDVHQFKLRKFIFLLFHFFAFYDFSDIFIMRNYML